MHRIVILLLSLPIAYVLSYGIWAGIGLILESIRGEPLGVGALGFFYPFVITIIIMTFVIYQLIAKFRPK